MRYIILFLIFVALGGLTIFLSKKSQPQETSPVPELETQANITYAIPEQPTTTQQTNVGATSTQATSTAADTEPKNNTPSQEPETAPNIPTQTLPEALTTPVVVEPESEPEPEPIVIPPPAPKKISWGVFTGSNQGSLNEFESRVDTNPDYLAWFVHWGNHGGELPSYVKEYAYEKDRTLVLFWEASDYIIGGTDQPAYAYRRILDGAWDDYIYDFKQQLTDYEGPVILIPFSELNGDWTPWSGTENGNTPEQAVEAFRYLHDRMADAPNISFGWAVNRMSVPNTYENRIERYYPGDAYVDYIGVDGFNKGNPWLTFEDIFAAPLTTLAQYKKPTFIFSFGSAPGPQKAQWLEDAFYKTLPQFPHVIAWVYFNQNKERNWLLWSDPASFAVFEEYISD